MEASKMESTARIQEEREQDERERERAAGPGDERAARPGDERVPEQSGANDQNRTDSDPGDAA